MTTREVAPLADWRRGFAVRWGLLSLAGLAAIVGAVLSTLTPWVHDLVIGAGGIVLGSSVAVLVWGLARGRGPRDIDLDKIVEVEPDKLDELMTQAIKSGTSVELLAKLFRALALRAESRWRNQRRTRRKWDRANWVLGGAGASLAGLAGGGVLAGINGWQRYVLGGASLLGAALGTLAASMQTARNAQLANLKGKLYEVFARETWHYVITELHGSSIDDAVAELKRRTKELAAIEELGATETTPPPTPPPTDASRGRRNRK